MWLVGNESVKYRLGVLNEIKHRNVEDIKIVSVDGLTRFGDTIDVVFPPTEIQRPSGTLHYEVCELQRFQLLFLLHIPFDIFCLKYLLFITLHVKYFNLYG